MFPALEAADTGLVRPRRKVVFTCLCDPASGALNRDLHLFHTSLHTSVSYVRIHTNDPITGNWTPYPLVVVATAG